MKKFMFDAGYVIRTTDFSVIESLRMDLKEKILDKKEELSYKKCALILKDLTYFTKLGMSLYDYVKQKYNIDIEAFKNSDNIDIEDLEGYIFYIFTELSNKIENERFSFDTDLLEDFDLSCTLYFYPDGEKTLFVVDAFQEEYLNIIEDHLDVEPYHYNPVSEEPPLGITSVEWINRAKDWLRVINKCGGDFNDCVLSAGGFRIELTENSMFMPEIEYVYKYMAEIETTEFDSLLDSVLQKREQLNDR